jgi:V8-like Glu-specific endopeptidase
LTSAHKNNAKIVISQQISIFAFCIFMIAMSQYLKGLFLLFTLPWQLGLSAQLSRGGRPLEGASLGSSFQWINLDDVRMDEFLLQDQADALRGRKNQRIAREIPVSLDPERDGTWEILPDGSRIWRLGIRAKGAKALGMVFNRYFLVKGARLFLYDPVKEKVLGAYTEDNNKSTAILPVSYLPGEELIMQLEVPANLTFYGELQAATVRYAYLPVFDGKSVTDGYFGRADTCNVDINCPEAFSWQELKRSVVRLINDELCTGVLVNNTSEDGKPYIFTAAHCVFDRSTGEYEPTVFYFGYESPSCNGPDGTAQYSIAGAALVATGDTSENTRDADSLDFALLELSITPPDSFMPYYAGWNRHKYPAQRSTCIHHPRGDVKKITMDDDPPETSYHQEDYFPELVKYSHWRIREWDMATTEAGSSGAPLFDQDMRVVGTLTGGVASCANPVNDYFTKFDYAWDYYDVPSKQLKHWLDPVSSGTMTLDGYDPLAGTGTKNPVVKGFRVWPNPAKDWLYIETGQAGSGMAEIHVYHISGKLMLRSRVPQSDEYTLNVSGLDTGVYILSVRADRHLSNQRFIIAR